jgi:hypothetical protein
MQPRVQGHPSIGPLHLMRALEPRCVLASCGFSGWRRGRYALSGLTGAQTLASRTWHRCILQNACRGRRRVDAPPRPYVMQ